MRVLFVSIAFPPKSDPEALQAGRYFKYLVRQRDIQVDVVTSRDPTLWMPTDESLRVLGEGAQQRLDIPIFEPRLLSIALGKLAPSLVMLPDLRVTFGLQSRRVAQSVQARPDVIYSRSFPLSSTLMGYRLHRRLGVPWIMHLSDPWTESAILRFRGLSRLFNVEMQRRCFAAAAAITLASPRMADLYRARFPAYADKFHVMPNVYDPSDCVLNAATAPGNQLRVVYTGSLQGSRSIRPLLQAVRRYDGELPLDVVIAGSLDSAERSAIAELATPAVRHVGQVSLSEAQRLQREADVLLAVDSPLRPEDSVFFPSKLLDYLVTGNAVLAITSPGSMTREVLSEPPHASFAHDEVTAIAAQLSRYAASKREGTLRRTGSVDERFSAEHNAERLARLLAEVA